MKRVAVSLALVTGLVVMSAPSWAQAPASAPASAPVIDAKASAAVKAMGAFLAQAKVLTFDTTMEVSISAPNQNSTTKESWTVSLQRPDRFAIVTTGKDSNAFDVYYDGKTITLFSPRDKKYMTRPAEATIEATLKEFGPVLSQMPFVDLLRGDPAAGLLEGVTSGSVVGEDKVDGVAAQHLQFTQEGGTWQLWIQAGEKPFPVKMVADFASPDGNAKLKLALTVSKWATPASLPESTFAFTAPKDAEKIDPDVDQASPAEALEGKAAPDFKLGLLDGGEVELSKLKGKVVILDFWATWCPPCREGLPVLADIAAQFKDKGVAFYAINQREDADTIKAFLKGKPYQLTVALDADGKVGDLYKVEGIPQTVIIGPDGNVAEVHVGFSPEMKADLIKTIEAALGSKK